MANEKSQKLRTKEYFKTACSIYDVEELLGVEDLLPVYESDFCTVLKNILLKA